MQYDQTFYNQQCSDNEPRHYILRVQEDGALFVGCRTIGRTDQNVGFTTNLYLDEQDREALAAALMPPKPGPALHWSELVAMGLAPGLVIGILCGALI